MDRVNGGLTPDMDATVSVKRVECPVHGNNDIRIFVKTKNGTCTDIPLAARLTTRTPGR